MQRLKLKLLLLFKILFLGIFLCGCLPGTSKVKGQRGLYFITPNKLNLSNLKELKWKVGILRKQVISRGVSFRIYYPSLSSRFLNEIEQKHGVDSWIVKITRRGQWVREELAHYSAKIGVNKLKDKKDLSKKRYTRLFTAVIVNYPDSFISAKHASLPCPVFKHNLKITDFTLKDDLTKRSRILVLRPDSVRDTIEFSKREKDPRRIYINGGKFLAGRYFVDLALYSSTTGRIYSNYVRYSQEAVIEEEKRVKVKGCQNFSLPKTLRNENPINQFKWKGN